MGELTLFYFSLLLFFFFFPTNIRYDRPPDQPPLTHINISGTSYYFVKKEDDSNFFRNGQTMLFLTITNKTLIIWALLDYDITNYPKVSVGFSQMRKWMIDQKF